MTNSTDHPAGIVTDAEAEALADSESPTEEFEAARARIRDRLAATLRDFSTLYQFLPDADLAAVFDAEEGRAQSEVRVGTQDGLALLVLGMLANGDMLEMRLRNAVQNAGISHGEEIDVSLELRRGPRPSIDEVIARADEEGYSETMVALFEYYLWDSATDTQQLLDLADHLLDDVSASEKQNIRTASFPFARPPQSVITGVSVADNSPTDTRDP